MIRILSVHPHSEIGGSDICLLRTAQFIDKSKFELKVILPREGPLVEALRQAGAEVSFLPIPKLTSREGPGAVLRYLADFVPCARRLAEAIRSWKPQVVHTHTLHCWQPALAARWTGIPHIWHIRELETRHRWAVGLESWLLNRFADRILTMSDAISSHYRPRVKFPEKMQRIYDGVDLRVFAPDLYDDTLRSQWGWSQNEVIIGMVTRLDRWKGIDSFVHMASELAPRYPQARFVVCGGEIKGQEGYQKVLTERAAKKGLDERVIKFTGWSFGFERIPEVMSALDVVVNASLSPEPFGLSLIEAMASGKPVIAYDAGGPKEIIKSGVDGVCVESGNPSAMVKAIASLVGDADKRRCLGKSARVTCESRFDLRKNIKNLEAVYETLCGKSES